MDRLVTWTVAVLAALALATAAAAQGSAVADAGGPYVVVLGIAQDGGAPQAGCRRACCAERGPGDRRHVASLGIVDPASSGRWLVDATPDLPAQLRRLDEIAPAAGPGPGLDGVLLTHAHVGHYTGLLHLGHEVMGAEGVPVWAMPRMRSFLTSNGPWSQLVEYGNIELRELRTDERVRLAEGLHVTPLRVPHREEFSEAVGFRIEGPRQSLLYIPDIDKWSRWDRSIERLVAEVDVALLDGTFYDDRELPGRDMSQIPHPFIVESLERFSSLPPEQRRRIHFIHLNHTNPALVPGSDAARAVEAAGLRIAREAQRFPL